MKAIRTSPRDLAFDASVADAMWRFRAGDSAGAIERLQRAHVLGQRDFARHLSVHWLMLRVAWRLRDTREGLGQVWRLLLVPLGHLTGRLPKGNPGTTNVSAFAPQPIAPELARLLDGDEV